MKSTTKKLQRLSAIATLTIGTLLAASSSAQAASFTSNIEKETDRIGAYVDLQGNLVNQNNVIVVRRNDNPKFTKKQNDDKFSKDVEAYNASRDIFLKSVAQNGKTIRNFSYVNKVDMTSTITELNGTKTQLRNDARVTGKNNSGAASTDKGRLATSPMATNEDPTGEQAAAFLGNNNLNNIIDTEDSGNFVMNLFFDKEIKQDTRGLDNLFFWERGMNSSMMVEAIDNFGRVIGNVVNMNQTRQASNAAGFAISTTEIGNSVQQVGSWGLSLQDFGVTSLAGIRVKTDKWSNGPDFKVIARMGEFNRPVTPVPEPGTILALGVVGGLGFLQRRRKQASLLK